MKKNKKSEWIDLYLLSCYLVFVVAGIIRRCNYSYNLLLWNLTYTVVYEILKSVKAQMYKGSCFKVSPKIVVVKHLVVSRCGLMAFDHSENKVLGFYL